MIRLVDLIKSYAVGGQYKVVADRINITFPTGTSIGLLGRNGAGKSSLLKMIAGTMDPDEGYIESSGSISWPVGFAGSFHPELSGAQNTRFLARVYGVDTDELLDYVQNFARLGKHFNMPFRTYSSGMRARLAFGISMGIQFDTYLVDEITSVGDAGFRRKSSEVFLNRLEHSGAVVVSHSMPQIREMCQAGAVLENGVLSFFSDVEEAIERHQRDMADET
jgi:capsular polysaccharide transport system ATP-binding protein